MFHVQQTYTSMSKMYQENVKECAEAKWQNQEVYPLQVFSQSHILKITLLL
jgi:hypothetical protein